MPIDTPLETNPLAENGADAMVRPLVSSTLLIGKALVEQGYLTQEKLDQLLAVQPEGKQRIGDAAVAQGFITDEDLARFLANFFHLPYLKLSDEDELDSSTVELIPEAMARRYGVIVTHKEGDRITLAMVDPLDVRAVDAVRLETRSRIRKAVSSRSAIMRAIEHYYHTASRLAKSMDTLLAVETSNGDTSRLHLTDGASLIDQLKLEASDAPVVQFVNLLLMRAVQERASDIHIEPEESSMTVRFRVDGQLREMSAPPKHMLQAITTRIKLLGRLDIAERRLPQDGRFNFTVFEKNIDVRLSCLPTIYGEKIVMRILDRGNLILDMKALGFEPEMLDVFRRMLTLPHGLIILTGPTGSGKTTTLYAALNSIKTPTRNIVTIEDPVEYQLSKINQVHTKSEIGLTFAAGLRSILRQDPDIIMVGEIRDRETAEICIRSALTGHLVLSTLHTNDAVSAVSRLTDMGIEPYLLSATLNLVMAQRLVRRICEDCAKKWQPPVELLERLSRLGKIEEGTWNFRRGKGCERCGGSGYLGRVAVYEPFVISEKARALIAEGAQLGVVRQAAKKEGLQSLFQSALNKVKEGITTLDEAFSICSTQSEIFD